MWVPTPRKWDKVQKREKEATPKITHMQSLKKNNLDSKLGEIHAFVVKAEKSLHRRGRGSTRIRRNQGVFFKLLGKKKEKLAFSVYGKQGSQNHNQQEMYFHSWKLHMGCSTFLLIPPWWRLWAESLTIPPHFFGATSSTDSTQRFLIVMLQKSIFLFNFTLGFPSPVHEQ